MFIRALLPIFFFYVSPAFANIIQVYSGISHSCAVLDTGAVKCWGRNDSGQLGLGDTVNRGLAAGSMQTHLPVLNLGTSEKVIQMALAGTYSCALFESGRVKCWGSGGAGNLGYENNDSHGDLINTMGDKLPFINFGTTEKVIQISTYDSTCAVFESGRIKCWGFNRYGALGLGDETNRGNQAQSMSTLTFVDLGTTDKIIQVASGSLHHCAIFETGKVKCWGLNSDDGELGLPDTNARGDRPNEMGAALPFLDFGTTEKVLQMSMGDYHSCAVFESGRAKCWGYNNNGQIAAGNSAKRGNYPLGLGTGLPFLDIGAGTLKIKTVIASGTTSCALFENGQMKCWGSNAAGSLGIGDLRTRGFLMSDLGVNLPFIKLGQSLQVKQISSGGNFKCALIDPIQEVKCWGANDLGQIGSEDPTSIGTTPESMGDNLSYVDLGD